MHLNLIQLNITSIQIQFKLHLQCCSSLISYMNELMFLTSRTFGIFLALQGYLYFPLFFSALSLGANNENLLHVIHCIVSLLPFG
jgi:hypothetical protein